ncbi:hypothetical protein DJ527_07020 [Sulfolobus sp. F1]|nr:hypothetical protein DJ527_07020 [Sulfolobus sp. F1]
MMMEKDLTSVDESYIKARVLEVIVDLILSIELWNRGLTRNSAGKAFNAVKALISALVLINMQKLIETVKDEKERKWLSKKGYSAPTHSIYGLSLQLKSIGIDVSDLINRALNLHDYQYNGFDPDFSRYRNKAEVKYDLEYVIDTVINILPKLFKDFWGKETEDLYKTLVKERETKV